MSWTVPKYPLGLLLLPLVFAASLNGQQIVTTFAGTDWIFPNNGVPALSAPIGSVLNAATDPQDRLVISDALNHLILRVESTGAVTVIAGNGIRGFSGDGGDARSASLDNPQGIAIDKSGNLFIGDAGNRRVRRVTPAGIITTYAGNGDLVTFSGDGGPATAAGIAPWRVALDNNGALFIADQANRRVRRVGADGMISTVAGDGQDRFSGEGRPARESSLVPNAIHIDSANRILISDTFNVRVYRIGTDGILTAIAGTGQPGFSGDGGPARAAGIGSIQAIATGAAGNILLADTSNRRIRRINSAGIISTIAGGSNTAVTSTPSDPLRANIGNPAALAMDSAGRLYLSDRNEARFLVLSADGRTVAHMAGNGKFKELLPRTPAILATMSEPAGIAIAPNGTVFVSESGGHRVFQVGPDGVAGRVTGSGINGGGNDDGPALNGRLASPTGLAMAPGGALLIADSGNNRIRRVANGVVTTIAGIAGAGGGYGGDGGKATEARLNNPWGIAADSAGNIFIADRLNHRVRRIDPSGVITTYAGNGRPTFGGDGRNATEASLNFPSAVAFNAAGELLIADYFNQRIRAVSSTGIIRTIAGNNFIASDGDGGPATDASITFPLGIATDREGNIYFSQDSTGTVRRIDASGIISTFAGQTAYGFAGDGGSPLNASFARPFGLAADGSGNVLIADFRNNRVRAVRNATLTATLSPSPVNLTAIAGSATATPVRVEVASRITGLPFTASVTYGQTPGNWLTVAASSDAAPATLTLNANASNLSPGRYTATLTAATTPAGSTNPVSVVLTVSNAPARLRISTESISFGRGEGGPPDTSVLEVRNEGGGTLDYRISSVGQWLKASPASGTLRAGQAGSVSVTADPAGLKTGTYLGSLTVTDGTVRTVVPVTLIVRGTRRTIFVSQAGLTFTAVAGGGTPTPQTIGILNVGSGSLSWRAAAKGRVARLGAGAGTVNEPWLEVSELAVSVVPAGLAPGQYYDQIEITGDADNSPQLVSVLLNVLPEGATPGPEVTPSAMVFIAKQGENPSSQTVTFNHLGKGAATYETSRLGTWYEAVPAAGRAEADQPSSLVVQPALAELTPGVRRGVVTFQSQEDGSVRHVNLLSVVAPRDAAGKSERNAASCASPALRVEATALRDGFSVRVGEAVTIEVKAADECGNLLTPLAGGTGAQAVARPENGDPQVTLAHMGNGVWRGTWRPVRATPNTRLTIVAIFLGTAADVIAGRSQAGKVELSGTVLAQGANSAPLLTAGGVVHAASFASGVPIAPGSLITLYGARLADATGQAGALPLPSLLNGTEVRLGDRPLPLLYTSDGQLNAQVPYDVPVDTQHQISVKRGDALAVPETLNVAPAQPGIFTTAQNGTGQGAIVKQDGITLAEPGTPAGRGEVVVIYCSGLGPVSPAVEAGRPAPGSPPSSTVNAVTVIIGGQEAQVLFAGLAPGFSGLYQINAFVPAESATGNAVEVTIESAGQRSRPVTIAVQ